MRIGWKQWENRILDFEQSAGPHDGTSPIGIRGLISHSCQKILNFSFGQTINILLKI